GVNGRPDASELSEPARRWSYTELDEVVRAAATSWKEAGVRPGDRVLLVCENGTSAVVIYFACVSLRAWPVIVNARISDRELDEIRTHCGARLAVFTADGSIHALRHAQK